MNLKKLAIVLGIIQFNGLHAQNIEFENLKIGHIVDDFSTENHLGERWILGKELLKGPIVLIFYRGQWCPFCNRHLSELQDSLAVLKELGVQVVAISPEKPEKINLTIQKTGAEFPILWDKDYVISDYFGLTFEPNGTSKAMYNTMLGADLSNAHSDTTGRLPIPATIIIDSSRVVRWVRADKNYRIRPSSSEIIEAVKNLEL